ncbi:MAG: PGF-pre-PGF domain-containing protein [Candidatus Aenigmatarchaeota archaeon]
MKVLKPLILSSILLILFSFVYAASFNIVPNSTNCISGTSNWGFNFTINNTNSTASIVELNITLPDVLEFINGSNSTNTISNFSYDSDARNLTWRSDFSLIDANSSAWFSFNLTIPLIFQTVNLSFTMLDNSSVINTTNTSVTVLPEKISTSKEFGLVPRIVYLNWTNDYQVNFSVLSNSSYNISVIFANGTGPVPANYSQENSRLYVYVKNNTGGFNTINFLPSFSNTNYTLLKYCHGGLLLPCAPGKYYGSFTIKNSSNSNENTSLEVIIDLPINLSSETGIGEFNGKIFENSDQYHSFYFNLSNIPNVTTMTLNLNFTAKDLDIFLLTTGAQPKLLAKSINKEGNESLMYNFIENSTTIFEIRIYGNSTSEYNGRIITLTLNSSEQEFDFGLQNVSKIPITKVFKLNNEGGISVEIVNESSQIFYVKRFYGNSPGNFTFFLPNSSIMPTLKINLNWTGKGAYNITLYNPDGIEIESSFNKSKNAEICNVEREEFIETINSAKDGFWKVVVKNTTTETPEYSLTIQAFVVNSSEWIKTNFTNYINKTFDVVGKENSTKTIELNFTIPEKVISGTYEGFLDYKSSNDGIIRIPIKVNITAPMLIVNNTLDKKEITILENYNSTLTRTFYINISNFGDYNLTTMFINSTRLNCTSCSYFANLSFNTTTEIQPHNSSLIEINVSFNSSMPKNLYEGWIYINSTHPTDPNLTSRPYSNINISIKLNLTDQWNVKILDLKSEDYGNETVNVSSKNSWVNASFLIQYVNGTNVTAGSIFSLDNITNVWLFEPNASYFVRNIVFKNITHPKITLSDDIWIVNLTIPQKLPGGKYYIHINLTSENLSSNSSNVYRGESLDDPVNKMLIVDDMGLLMNLIDYPSQLQNGSSGIINVTIKNLGPRYADNVQIAFEKCNYISSVSFFNTSCVKVGTPSDKVNFTLSPYNYTGCYVAWKITAGNTEGTCTSWIKGTSGLWFVNSSSFETTVSVPETTSTITTTTTLPNTINMTTTTSTTSTTTTTTTLPPSAMPVNVSFQIQLITPESPAIITIPYADTLKIWKIALFVNKNISNVTLTVKEGIKPESVPPAIKTEEGLVLKYLEISSVNLHENDITNVLIDFQIEKSWVIENGIDVSTISIYRFSNNTWKKLQTVKINETQDYYQFRAISPGLSLFAIAGNWAGGFLIWPILLALGIIIAGVLAFLFWPVKEESPIAKVRAKEEEVHRPWKELKKKWEELKKMKKSR